MLIRFRVKNFRSFRDEQELSLVPSRRKDLEGIVRHPKGLNEGILPSAVIYGANASGKSNVLKALSYMENAVRNSHKTWAPEQPIRTDPFLLTSKQTNAMKFEADLLLDGVRYEYGFVLDSERVVKEWLNAYPNGRRQLWLARNVEESRPFRFGKQLTGENRAIENLTRRNSLFLSAAAQNNHEQLLPIYSWFAEKLFFVTENRDHLVQSTASLCKKTDLVDVVVQFMTAADLGIVGLDIAEDARSEQFKTFYEGLARLIENQGAPPPPAEAPPLLRVALKHRGSDNAEVVFTEHQESKGTMAWFGLLGEIVAALATGRTLCIDELDASLHPLLATELVRLFHDPKRNPSGAQLIFNTHDTNLLDPKLFRRDQIWFVEKDEEGASHLYALTDFKPRRMENLERGYLQGRYGAIPFFSAANAVASDDREQL